MPTSETDNTPQQEPSLSSKEKALCYARWAMEKKAYGMSIRHMGPLTSIAEYFVICSGKSVRQARAIANHIRTRLKEASHPLPLGMEGEREGIWILLDCDDVVVHVFHEPTRELYSLDKLWADAAVVMDPQLMEAIEMTDRERLAEEDEDWED